MQRAHNIICGFGIFRTDVAQGCVPALTSLLYVAWVGKRPDPIQVALGLLSVSHGRCGVARTIRVKPSYEAEHTAIAARYG